MSIFENSPTGWIDQQIFVFVGSNNADSHKMCLLGVWLILLPIYGVKSPKPPILGVWIGFFQANIWNFYTVKTTAPIGTKCCAMIETTKCSSWFIQICPLPKNPGWWSPSRKSKNHDISAIDCPILTKFGRWCVSAFRTPSANKMLRFPKSKMMDGHHFETEK